MMRTNPANQDVTLSEMLDLSESPSTTQTSADDFVDVSTAGDSAESAAAEGIADGAEDAVAETLEASVVEGGILAGLASAGRVVRKAVEDNTDDDDILDFDPMHADQILAQDPTSTTHAISSSVAGQESTRNLTTSVA